MLPSSILSLRSIFENSPETSAAAFSNSARRLYAQSTSDFSAVKKDYSMTVKAVNGHVTV